MVAGGAEALPDRVGLALLDRTDRAPLGLELLDLERRLIPVARFGQRLGLRAQRILLREVVVPRGFALREILVAAREEPIARRAEPVPDRLFFSARHRADGFPLGLQLLDRVGGLNPRGRLGLRLGGLAERGLSRQVRRPLLRVGGEARLALGPDFVVRGLEPAPERIRLRARHISGLRATAAAGRAPRGRPSRHR